MAQCTYVALGIRCEEEEGHEVGADGTGHTANIGTILAAMARAPVGTMADAANRAQVFDNVVNDVEPITDEELAKIRELHHGTCEAMVRALVARIDLEKSIIEDRDRTILSLTSNEAHWRQRAKHAEKVVEAYDALNEWLENNLSPAGRIEMAEVRRVVREVKRGK